jgi:hypothetical protein
MVHQANFLIVAPLDEIQPTDNVKIGKTSLNTVGTGKK